ncbi:hypothetical protein [Citrobacter freundii]|uniref:hypothetical protein n=1 Tax=Citrobacter freundii TaxID=546 RepID=UPI001F310146|nr:hypothetical protein [Citrobacter freundii]
MTTNNHPAQGPVSLDRLHQIREILSKAAAQSDGGNLGYAMADAVKVIDVAIAAFGAELAPCPKCNDTGMADSGGVQPWGEPIFIECDCRAAMLRGIQPVSNRDELPLGYLQGHKDGLEWAAQLAEANHPQTGDWLYDDPIDLAKAIRKGPHMPELKLVPADADDNFYSWFGRFWYENYQKNNYTTSAKQMLGTMAEFAYRAGRESAALAGNSPATPDGLLGCGENCWSCGKYFTYEQHSECDGYCPHCNSPVDLDDEEEQSSKVVPTEPTEEMIYNAWREAIGKCDHETIKRIYATMLAAAPQQEVK